MSQFFDMTDPIQRREGLAAASAIIQDGRLVVLPTDTVYGVGANAFEPHAVGLLLAAKGRGRSMPAPVLVHRPEALDGIGTEISQEVRDLTAAFWPGALTVIVHQQPSVNLDLGDSMGTVAVRMPDDDVALDLLAFTGPLAVSSANRTGHPAAETAEDAQEQLGEAVDAYLSAGPRGGGEGVASTIVDATGEVLRVVRQGAISLEALRDVVPSILGLGEEAPSQEPETPGEAVGEASEPPAEGVEAEFAGGVHDDAPAAAAEAADEPDPAVAVLDDAPPAQVDPAGTPGPDEAVQEHASPAGPRRADTTRDAVNLDPLPNLADEDVPRPSTEPRRAL
ncbi:L-threonylcarbamoyladenylate synthase [Falsarthrobacter nasiphocae]|uniref:L-threonylcarbamoyladenylate synthase n=1 Tax=Falsarthrobacter nasiphocae TaxID=189863 RepID=A0AAE3YIQ7_9MICC|nr:L-threonylcarbamoyladenylate synthase [Falsarthrobacter nasiphocae]MDR6892766.1 tRNA threonylcarbamoyl adenosine modification protein (Sua5/YciO/YrdC/YwlC family) [Falsarthrobacter nasiphocae]